ncbi:hypothetical protein AKJ09_07266 [Labilithrix luteola]|uniref:DUF899 domain-containing protein n=1 Tax=Labilithrix luteola TaxID=1391654 RepID=A0A0K1Q4E2_9BACT|nr:thioredoxin family protein [Labilithrix luteola]AKV00603.1 hypothetical protein AKJ09_07266 [Labilithrix luteola]
MTTNTNNHPVVTRSEWLRARKEFLNEEKEMTHLRDRLSEKRRNLPWVRVEEDYRFEGPRGKAKLADLFEGRSQLLVYHFMFAPEWEEGCKSCSFWADNFERSVVHLKQRDITFVAISRAPSEKLAAFEKRMGWTFPWYSTAGSSFNHDFSVSFTPEEVEKGTGTYNYGLMKPPISDMPGISVFYKDPSGAIFHTYSTFGRGIEGMNATYQYLDLVPKGRDENGKRAFWLRHWDRYEP